jgi:hypothetical protein
VLTARERLTAPGVVIHLPHCCAPACYAGVRSECGYGPREARLQTSSRPPLQSKSDSAQLNSSCLTDPTSPKGHLALIEIP